MEPAEPAPEGVTAPEAAPETTAEDFQVTFSDFIVERSGKIRDTYKIGHKIGDGAFGSVRKITHRRTGEVRAVKTISKTTLSEEEKVSFFNEVAVLRAVDHPNILKLFEFYQDSKNFYLVTELCTGGELFDRISERGHFSEAQAAKYMYMILSAVQYCHSQNIVHRDLKPENFMLESAAEDAPIKVIDFGTAQFNRGETMRKKYGTPYYIAPEVLRRSYDNKCDVWSAGVNMYILLCGFPPFHGKTDEEIMRRVERGTFTFPSPEWDAVSEEAKSLIQAMLTYDPAQRLSAEQSLNHPWFHRYFQKTLDNTVLASTLSNLRQFKTAQKLQKAILTFIASQLSKREDTEALRGVFRALDANNDGKLSRDELVQGWERAFGACEDVETEVDRIMGKVDADRSGFIDYTEFVIATMDIQKMLSSENLQAAFNAFDIDQSGTIDKTELATILSKNGQHDVSYWESIIGEIDVNGDGEIDFQEFVKMMADYRSG